MKEINRNFSFKVLLILKFPTSFKNLRNKIHFQGAQLLILRKTNPFFGNKDILKKLIYSLGFSKE